AAAHGDQRGSVEALRLVGARAAAHVVALAVGEPCAIVTGRAGRLRRVEQLRAALDLRGLPARRTRLAGRRRIHARDVGDECGEFTASETITAQPREGVREVPAQVLPPALPAVG